MTVPVDETTVREFIDIISSHVIQIAKGNGHGVLQLCQLSPFSEKMVPSRFRLDDVDTIVKAAVGAANASLNVYIEARTLRADLRGSVRGGLSDTELVFGIVVDADNDKGKGGSVTVRPSLVIETSPGNFHYWYLLSQPVTAHQAKTIDDTIRDSTGADHATGVITQCYRVAGTPNFPSKAKQARGRTSVEPTRIVERTGRLWDPFELMAAFAARAASGGPAGAAPLTAIVADEASLPDELMRAIRDGGVSRGLGAKKDKSRSGLFHHVIGELKKRRWSVDQIHALPRSNRMAWPLSTRVGCLRKSSGRTTASRRTVLRPPSRPNSPVPTPPAADRAVDCLRLRRRLAQRRDRRPAGNAPLHVLPTIRLRDGQPPRAVEETERAELWPAIEGLRALAGFDLGHFDRDLQPLGLGEPGDRRALCFEAFAGPQSCARMRAIALGP